MRDDVITVSSPSTEYIEVLDALRAPDARIHVQDFSDGSSGLGLSSELADHEYRIWVGQVFDVICAATTANVELLDEDDNVIRSRPAVHAA